MKKLNVFAAPFVLALSCLLSHEAHATDYIVATCTLSSGPTLKLSWSDPQLKLTIGNKEITSQMPVVAYLINDLMDETYLFQVGETRYKVSLKRGEEEDKIVLRSGSSGAWEADRCRDVNTMFTQPPTKVPAASGWPQIYSEFGKEWRP